MYCSVSEAGIANMKDSWFFDNNFNGLSDDIFDDVVGFFDFPLEEVEEDWDSQLKCLEDQHSEVFSASSNGLCDKTQTENPQFGTEFSVSVSILSTIWFVGMLIVMSLTYLNYSLAMLTPCV